ncbi:tyrosine-protein kinase-like [Saccoglossus kowalevskii]
MDIMCWYNIPVILVLLVREVHCDVSCQANVYIPLPDVTYTAGYTSILNCTYVLGNECSDSTAVLYWVSNGDTIAFKYGDTDPLIVDPDKYAVIGGGDLIIRDTQHEDAGEYECIVDLLPGNSARDTVILTVVGIYFIFVSLIQDDPNPGWPVCSTTTSHVIQPGIIQSGDVITIVCEATDGNPFPVLTWYNGTDILEGDYSTPAPGEIIMVTSNEYTWELDKYDNGKTYICEGTHLSTVEYCDTRELDVKCSMQSVTTTVLSRHGTDWEIKSTSITHVEHLWSGPFTHVMKSIMSHNGRIEYAIGKLLKDGISMDGRQCFLKEISYLKSIKHSNIIAMRGCCTLQEPMCVLLEECPYGTLRDYLQNSKANYDCPFGEEFIIFGIQIANGLNYLVAKECVVRTLAARNIYLGVGRVCKISDLGFSTAVMTSDEFETSTSGRLPIRWMALESLMDCFYTTKSDTWSYGIVLWEIFNFGDTPYPGMSIKDVLHELENGYRMPKPRNCIEKMYTLMTDCWKKDPSSRPSYEQIIRTLEHSEEIGMASDTDEANGQVYVNSNFLNEIC